MAGNQPQRKQLPFDDQRAKLYAPPAQGSTKRPTLTWGFSTRKFVANSATITVKTQVDGDKNFGRIDATIPMPQLYTMFRLIDNVIKTPGEQSRSIRIYTDFLAGKKTDSPVPVSNFIVGKESDGRVYLALVAKNRPNFKFYMTPDDFYRLVVDGQEMSTEEYYAACAEGYMRYIQDIFASVVNSEFVAWEPNGGNGGGNNNGYSGGGNQSNNQSWGNDSGGDEPLW